MSNPLDQIEDANSQRDIGAVSYRIFQGARSEGAPRYESFLIVCAWFYAMFKQTYDVDTENEE